MIGLEYGFHNENDYSEFDRKMKDEKLSYIGVRLIYRELTKFYNILTY